MGRLGIAPRKSRTSGRKQIWQWVYSQIGMPLEAWDDVEEED